MVFKKDEVHARDRSTKTKLLAIIGFTIIFIILIYILFHLLTTGGDIFLIVLVILLIVIMIPIAIFSVDIAFYGYSTLGLTRLKHSRIPFQ